MSDLLQLRLMTPSEVATLFGVTPKTIATWADRGQLRTVRTIGGHRRYIAAEVDELLRLPTVQDIQHFRGDRR